MVAAGLALLVLAAATGAAGSPGARCGSTPAAYLGQRSYGVLCTRAVRGGLVDRRLRPHTPCRSPSSSCWRRRCWCGGDLVAAGRTAGAGARRAQAGRGATAATLPARRWCSGTGRAPATSNVGDATPARARWSASPSRRAARRRTCRSRPSPRRRLRRPPRVRWPGHAGDVLEVRCLADGTTGSRRAGATGACGVRMRVINETDGARVSCSTRPPRHHGEPQRGRRQRRVDESLPPGPIAVALHRSPAPARAAALDVEPPDPASRRDRGRRRALAARPAECPDGDVVGVDTTRGRLVRRPGAHERAAPDGCTAARPWSRTRCAPAGYPGRPEPAARRRAGRPRRHQRDAMDGRPDGWDFSEVSGCESDGLVKPQEADQAPPESASARATSTMTAPRTRPDVVEVRCTAAGTDGVDDPGEARPGRRARARRERHRASPST